MNKSFSILAIMLFVCVSFVLAQDKISREKPDFSGNWELDKKESSSVAKSLDFYTIKISQTGEEIQIHKNFKSGDQTVDYTLVLFTDKRGEKNVVPFGEKPTEIKSETYWHKDQIYFDYSYFLTNAAYRRNMYYRRNIEKYKLSEDGKTLTIMYDRRSSTQVSGDSIPNIKNIPISTKLVFRKADG